MKLEGFIESNIDDQQHDVDHKLKKNKDSLKEDVEPIFLKIRIQEGVDLQYLNLDIFKTHPCKNYQ